MMTSITKDLGWSRDGARKEHYYGPDCWSLCKRRVVSPDLPAREFTEHTATWVGPDSGRCSACTRVLLERGVLERLGDSRVGRAAEYRHLGTYPVS